MLMADRELIGVYREERFSPGKVEDDRAIIDLAAEVLRGAGLRVRMVDGDRLPALEEPPALVFAMCQSGEALAWLDAAQAGCPVVNSADGIRGCYRVNLVERLDRAGVPQPRWQLAGPVPPHDLGEGPWLKRGDVHAMEAGDVRRVFGTDEWDAFAADFRRRGIRDAIVQSHVEGPVYKFYGVKGGFFRAFGLPAGLEPRAAALAENAADAVGLEIYGGDGVASPDGSIHLIDVNDWPSFSRCRADAGPAIGRRLLQILESTRSDER
jgi:hypothetical protein